MNKQTIPVNIPLELAARIAATDLSQSTEAVIIAALEEWLDVQLGNTIPIDCGEGMMSDIEAARKELLRVWNMGADGG